MASWAQNASFLLGFLTLFAAGAGAQVLTGSLIGTVQDETGAVLPGATVQVSSPALPGGPETAIADQEGQFRFPRLTPGLYTLAIELEQFAPYREDSIAIEVQGTIERIVTLELAGVSESVSVQGSAVDAARSGLAAGFDRTELASIPVRRFSMFDFIRAAPGVSPTSPSSGIDPGVSVFGSGANENLFLLDGTNFTCPCSGGPVPQPDVDTIQEIHVDSLGASAEFGNVQGAVFNVVTKQGGNLFAYDASYYGQTDGLTSQPLALVCARCSEGSTQYVRAHYRDFTTHLGGPIVRERVWFYGGYQYLRDADSQPGTDPLFPRASEYDKVFLKATWKISPSLSWMSSVQDEFWVNPQRPTLVQPFSATVRVSGTRPTATLGHLTDTISSNTLLDARVSRFHAPQTSDPSTGDRTTPNRVDLATGIQSGGPAGFGGLTLARTTVAASLSHYRPLRGTSHEFRIGLQVENGKHWGWTAFQGGVVNYTDNGGRPVQATFRQTATAGGQFTTSGLYAMDTVRFADRFTLNLGVRYDHTRAISPDVPARNEGGEETGSTVAGLGTLYIWNTVSPRLGLTTKLSSDGRTILRASYGRFYQGVLTGELAPVHPGMTPTTTAAFDTATGQYSRIIAVVDPTANVRLDPGTSAPRTDQIGVSLDRELGDRASVTLSYVHKEGRDVIGWTDVGGLYRSDSRSLPDGQALPVLVLTNGTAARRFLLTNQADYFLRYNGMLVGIERRWTAGRLLASYTLSKAEGLQPTSAAPAGFGQFSSTFGGNPFGRDPNTLTNATGTLSGDRTHMFRVMGTLTIPRTRFVLATNLQYFTGLPWAASTQVVLPQGLTRILLETPGTRRLPSQTLVDLRLSHAFELPGTARAELLVDVLNALNSTAAERLADDNLFSQNFARPSVLVDPRRAMLGVRFTFPR